MLSRVLSATRDAIRAVWPAVALTLVTVTLGCEAPRWRVHASPEDSTLFVDGRARRPGTALDERIPYYGTVEVAAAPDPDAATLHSPVREHVELIEPVTPWLFPIDFVIEVAGATFTVDPVPTTALVLPEQPEMTSEESAPPGMLEFEARARAVSTRR